MTLLAPDRRRDLLKEEASVGRGGVDPTSPPGAGSQRETGGTGVTTVHRVIVAVAAIGLLGPAFATWSGIISMPLSGVASVIITAGSLALLMAAVTVKTERSLRRVEVVLLVLGVVTLAAWATSVVSANPAYGTDEAAFEQYAAGLLLNGLDPYAHSLLPALLHYRVPIQYATYTTSGGVVSTLGYPALPILLVVPFLWLTHGVQSVLVLNVVALTASMIIAFFVLPRHYRSLAVVAVVGLPILFGYTVAGVNVILAIPFLIVVAWRFTETGAEGRLGRRGIGQALCLGLAISVQQIAWFILPFVVVAVWSARRTEMDRSSASRVVGRYVGIALVTFAAVNAGFIAAGAREWVEGIFEPLVQHAIPYGQGIIDLSVFAGIGGGNLSYYTYGAVVLLLGLLVSFRLFFLAWWRCTFLLPSLALFFPTRSLAEYWMTLVLIWVVSLFAASPHPLPPGAARGQSGEVAGWRFGRAAIAAISLLPGLGLLTMAVGSPAPLSVGVVGIRTNGQYERVWELTLRVVNHSHEALRPHFATNSIGQMTPFWHRLSGPATLRAGTASRYLLAAPNVGSMPGITQPFQIDAVTNSPETISVTRNVTTEPYSTWIYQSDVDQVLAPGQTVDLTVQLHSPLGGAVDRAGVPVELGQVIYGQSQLVPSEARVNGAPEGQTPVAMKTDPHGQATFRVTDSSPQGQPIYFQAWTTSREGYPFGYSETVDVLWSGR